MTTRRTFLATAVCAAATLAVSRIAHAQAHSPFKLSVITDEVSSDFDHACAVAANDFGLQWVELRSLWGKNVADLKSDDITRAQAILAKYNLRVTDIASPLFKVDWPGAPRSKFSAQNDSFAATADFKKQDEVLVACIELAKQFKTGKIRCFDFWQLDDSAPYRAAIDDKLRAATETCRKQDIALILENEHECNTVTAAEIVRLLKAVPALGLNWAPPMPSCTVSSTPSPPAGRCCPRTASTIATARTPSATPPVRWSGLQSTSASSTGPPSSVPSNPSATAMPSRSKRTGAERARPKPPAASVGPG